MEGGRLKGGRLIDVLLYLVALLAPQAFLQLPDEPSLLRNRVFIVQKNNSVRAQRRPVSGRESRYQE